MSQKIGQKKGFRIQHRKKTKHFLKSYKREVHGKLNERYIFSFTRVLAVRERIGQG